MVRYLFHWRMSLSKSVKIMNGKKFIAILFSFFLIFAIVLFYFLFTDGWFETFINGGFEALYGKD